MCPVPRAAIGSASRRASTIGARRFTASARSMSSTENDVMWPLPGRAAFATSTSISPASASSRSTSAAAERSAAIARPPVSAASGSSTSARRPVTIGTAPRAASARAIAVPRPPVAPVTRAVRPRSSMWRASLREDRDGRGEAVQEVLAADRADLAGGEEPGRRRVEQGLRQRVGVVVGVGEHVAPAPVAGEQQRTRRRAAAERGHLHRQRLAQVTVRAEGVARVQPHDLAGVHVGGHGHLSARRVRAHEPDQQPALDHLELLGRERLDRLAQRHQRRPAGQLLDHVAVGGGDRELRPYRGRTLRDAREHLDAVEPDADGALVEHLLAHEEDGAVAGASGGEPAEQGDHRRRIGEEAQHRVGRERRRVGEQDRAGGAVEVRHAGQRTGALFELLDGRMEGHGAAIAQVRRPDRDRRALLDLPVGTDHAAGAAAHELLGHQRLVDRLEQRLGHAEVQPRGEDDREVAAVAAEGVAGRDARLDRRFAGVGGRREAGTDPDGHRPPTILRAMKRPSTIIAIFGPTGIGKTAVAIALAERLRAEGEDPAAISADALQLYEGLEILTSAPSPEERSRLEHRLVGTLPLTATSSAGDFARRAHAEIDALLEQGRRPIVVGGTGLYLRAALAELDMRPPVDPALRERRRAQLEAEGAPALHAELAARAPATAAAIRPHDAQRVTRALELLDAGHEPTPGTDASQLWTAGLRRPTLLA